MSSLAQTLGYLSEVTKFASQGPVSYGMGECVCLVRPYTVMAGMLSKSDTDKLVDDYVNVRGGSLDGYGRVPVVISLRTLVYEDPRRPAKGLLLVPAMLDINGRLSMEVGTQRPWIPLERLSAAGSAPRTVTVASLAGYRHFQLEHQAEFADPVTWGVYVDLAQSMFDAIAHVDPSGLEDSNCRVDAELCRIKCVSLKEPTLTASNVFSFLAGHPEGSLPGTLRPYFGEQGDLSEDDAPTLTISRDELKQAEEKREAQASRAQEKGQGEAEEQEDKEPPTSGPAAGGPSLPAAHDDAALDAPIEPTSLRAIDRLMQNAKLRRGSCLATQRLSSESYDLLRLMCSEHSDPLSCIQLPMGTEEFNIAAAVAAARVTDCAVRGADEPYLLFGISSGVFRRRAEQELDEGLAPSAAPTDPAASSSPLWGPWLRRDAPKRERTRVTARFLDSARAFCGHSLATPEAAARLLSSRLRQIDALRCELIDGYAEMRTASDLARQQEERLLALARLRDEHRRAQRRLEYWSGLAEQSRAHRALGRGRGGQREALREAAEGGDALAASSSSVEDVLQKYQELVRKQEEKLASTRRETAKLELRVKRHSLSGTKGAETVDKLVGLCKLNRTGKRELDSLFAGGALTAQKLDAVLDRTVRPCEFWLAVHLYEARELQRPSIRPVPRWRTVATIYEIPGLVGKVTGEPPIDLLFCLRAERMRTPQALSCLALSRRAIVMGDATGIGPRWELDTQADADIAHLTMDADGWRFVCEHELGASTPQRFFSATKVACRQLPRTSYQLHCLNPSKGAITRYRAEAFYGGAGAQSEHRGVGNLYLFAEGEDGEERVGTSVRNHAEAERIVSWIQAIMPRVTERFGEVERPICVLTPYASQAQLVRDLLNASDVGTSRKVDVRPVRQATGTPTPIVVLSGVTSVEALQRDFSFGVDSILSVCAASALNCLAVFCAASWRTQGAEQSVAVECLARDASVWQEPKEPVLPVAVREASQRESAGEIEDNGKVEGKPEPEDETSTLAASQQAPASPEVASTAPAEPDGAHEADAGDAEEASAADASATGVIESANVSTNEPEAEHNAEPMPSAPVDSRESAPVGAVAPGEKDLATEREVSDPGSGTELPSEHESSAGPASDVPQGTADRENPGKRGDAEPKPRPKVYATLGQVLHELCVVGKLPEEPERESVFRWLQRDGFVRVSSARDGSIGWVPTQRGVRCGMRPQQSDDGSLWCGFSDGSAEYVLASIQLHSKNR